RHQKGKRKQRTDEEHDNCSHRLQTELQKQGRCAAYDNNGSKQSFACLAVTVQVIDGCCMRRTLCVF
ncbi:MAG: hypothetical protein ACLSWV_01240, partial [Pygmaiobacter massiliensis]